MPAQPQLFDALSEALRSALVAARKEGDRELAAALRSTLSALEHARAVPAEDRGIAIENAPTGAGSTDVPRREVGDEEAAAIVASEILDLETAAATFDDAGRPQEAAGFRHAAARLRHVLAAAEAG